MVTRETRAQLEAIFEVVVVEYDRAHQVHPKTTHLSMALAEEVGEVIKDINGSREALDATGEPWRFKRKQHVQNARVELIQVLSTALRLLIEGDPDESFPAMGDPPSDLSKETRTA